MSTTHQPRILRLPANRTGQDFIASPVLGQFDALERALERAAFNPGRDRLIGVGNLIGPGAQSACAGDWLGDGRMVSVLGREEARLLEWANAGAGEDLPDRLARYAAAGGHWLLEASPAASVRCIMRVRELPFALHVALPDGRSIGVVHGELPLGVSWNRLHAALEGEDMRTQVLYGHRRILAASRARQDNRTPAAQVMHAPGVDVLVAAGLPSASMGLGNMTYVSTDAQGLPTVERVDELLARIAERNFQEAGPTPSLAEGVHP